MSDQEWKHSTSLTTRTITYKHILTRTGSIFFNLNKSVYIIILWFGLSYVHYYNFFKLKNSSHQNKTRLYFIVHVVNSIECFHLLYISYELILIKKLFFLNQMQLHDKYQNKEINSFEVCFNKAFTLGNESILFYFIWYNKKHFIWTKTQATDII